MEHQEHAAAASGVVPQEAIAYLGAVRNYYQPGVTRRPRNADIAAAHEPRLNPRTWDRRKDLLRNGKLDGRDWIEVWPPPPDWQPSWEHLLPQQLALPEVDDVVHIVFDEAYDKNGKLLERRLIRTLGHLSAAAALFAGTLDLSDGRLDHVVQVCRLLIKTLPDVVRRVS